MHFLTHHICSSHQKTRFPSTVGVSASLICNFLISIFNFKNRPALGKEMGCCLTYSVEGQRTPSKQVWQGSDEFLTQISLRSCVVSGLLPDSLERLVGTMLLLAQTISKWTRDKRRAEAVVRYSVIDISIWNLVNRVSPHVKCTTDIVCVFPNTRVQMFSTPKCTHQTWSWCFLSIR